MCYSSSLVDDKGRVRNIFFPKEILELLSPLLLTLDSFLCPRLIPKDFP